MPKPSANAPLEFFADDVEYMKLCLDFTVYWAGLVDELGGYAHLQAQLGEAIALYRVPNGVIIRAGVAPSGGDVNRKDRLPAYHEVGRVLQPVRVGDHPAFIMKDEDFDEEVTEAWLGHFDH